MILKLVLIGNFVFAADSTTSEWTNKTETVKVVSYDANCVQVKDKTGKRISLKRSGFKGMKLISGTTEGQIHPDSLTNSICAK